VAPDSFAALLSSVVADGSWKFAGMTGSNPWKSDKNGGNCSKLASFLANLLPKQGPRINFRPFSFNPAHPLDWPLLRAGTGALSDHRRLIVGFSGQSPLGMDSDVEPERDTEKPAKTGAPSDSAHVHDPYVRDRIRSSSQPTKLLIPSPVLAETGKIRIAGFMAVTVFFSSSMSKSV
jgi:hypothetical protein